MGSPSYEMGDYVSGQVRYFAVWDWAISTDYITYLYNKGNTYRPKYSITFGNFGIPEPNFTITNSTSGISVINTVWNSEGQYWYFNGSDAYIRLEGAINSTFNGKDVMTFSCWLYKESKTSTNAFYSCHEGASNRYIYNINDNNTFRFYYSGDKFKSTFDFVGQWTHFAVTRNGGTFIFYINGYRITDNIISGYGYSNPSTMGSYVYTSNTRFSLGQEWDSNTTASDFYKGKNEKCSFLGINTYR